MLFKEASTASEATQRAPARPFEAFGGEGHRRARRPNKRRL